MYVRLPEWDTQPGDENMCGKLLMSMYDTRDAALNWAIEYCDTLKAAGYVQGKGNPCLFFNEGIGVAVMVHGDDFIGVGPDKHLDNLKSTLENKYKLKIERLGKREGEKLEIRILNKIVRETDAGIELEADPRHAEIDAKASQVPGSKEESKKSVATSEAQKQRAQGEQRRELATTRARSRPAPRPRPQLMRVVRTTI